MTTDTTEIQKIVRVYYEQQCAKKFENLGEMDKFLETYNLPKLNQEEAERWGRRVCQWSDCLPRISASS